MNRAIMIGAGQIGRGFIGMELERAGYHVLFADINMDIIQDIRRRGSYTVRVVDKSCRETEVTNISAVSSADPAFPDEFARPELSLVCTSVGLSALEKVAPLIARGISRRRAAGIREPLNIIAAENAVGGSTILKEFVYSHLNAEERRYSDELAGFPDCAVDRIIPPNKAGTMAADVAVEKYFEWDVERKNIKAELLPIEGMNIVEELGAYLERKLFTLNGPNAITACYGLIKGYKTINESLADSEIYELVWGVMEECGRMLSLRHGFSAEEMLDYRTKLMQRFENPYVVDSNLRVAREPLRKLAPGDRIIAPYRYAKEYGLETGHYLKGIACVLSYDNPEEAQSAEMQRLIKTMGLRAAAEKITGIKAESQDMKAIEAEYIILNKLKK